MVLGAIGHCCFLARLPHIKAYSTAPKGRLMGIARQIDAQHKYCERIFFVARYAPPKRRRMHMKYSEFRQWLKAQGVEFQPGKGSHFKVP